MHTQIADVIAHIKQEFAAAYSGSAHIQEVLPSKPSEQFPMQNRHLNALHKFAESNPIYHNSFEQKIAGVLCTVYEGDINEYWLGSIKHASSCQPFYPTWLASAFVLAHLAQNFGCTELVDIGSGDGRIAFCAAILGMHACSIEIDAALVELQHEISKATGVCFNPTCANALEIDYYSEIKLSKPAFVVGGLPQMGGEMLAEGLINRINHSDKKSDVFDDTSDAAGNDKKHTQPPHRSANSYLVVLTGEGKRSGPAARRNAGSAGGWESLIARHDLRVIHSVNLPTVWTFDQDEDTPYIYAEGGSSPSLKSSSASS